LHGGVVDSEETGTGGGLGAFLSSAPRVIGSITALIGAVTGLLIALNKTGVIGGDGGDGPPRHRPRRSKQETTRWFISRTRRTG